MASQCDINIKYVLIFDNYEINNNIITSNYIPINNKFERIDPQYAIVEKDGKITILEKYKNESFIMDENEYWKYFLSGYLSSNGKQVKYIFNLCNLNDDIEILEYDQDKFKTVIDINPDYNYHIYLNKFVGNTPMINKITLNETKYFVVITKKTDNNIIQILNNKIDTNNDDIFKNNNIFFYYLKYEIYDGKISWTMQKCIF